MKDVTTTILRWTDHTAAGLELIESLTEAGVPANLHEGLVRYLLDGIRPGQFLCAMLNNNLSEAVLRYTGDLNDLKRILLWLLNCTPSPCSGGLGAVDKWVGWKTGGQPGHP